MTRNAILTVNAGSSSLKCALHGADDPAERLGKWHIDRVGSGPVLHSGSSPGQTVPQDVGQSHRELLIWLLKQIDGQCGGISIVAAGHRVVHGGRDYTTPVVVSDGDLERLAGYSSLAPDHQPHNLAGIAAIRSARPDIPQVACFDTAFHRTQPRLAQLFALPRALLDDGVLRYGFHGLSYEYIASVLPRYLGARSDGRIVVAHLGHGASMCAMHCRRSVATSMGFTALDGLVMGKRCGELDPGVVLHLLRDRGMSLDDVEDLLTQKSGLLGVSGISDDMRDLVASQHPNALEAVDLFVYRACRRIGSLAAVLNGLDALVFTGGIGEHSAEIRARIIVGCEWLGCRLDAERNLVGMATITADDSAVTGLAIATDEEQIIARQTLSVLAKPATPLAEEASRADDNLTAERRPDGAAEDIGRGRFR